MPPASANKTNRERRPSGQRTKDKIRTTVRDILIDEGAAGLTMRNIADKAGITHANVQYYFPKREDLIEAMFEEMYDWYQGPVDAIVNNPTLRPEQIIQQYFEFFFRDSLCDKRRKRFFIQLWSLMISADNSAGLIQRLYDHIAKQISGILKKANPQLSAATRTARAKLLTALMEGLILVHWPEKNSQKSTEALIAETVNQAVSIAFLKI